MGETGFKCRGKTLCFNDAPKIMGILNVTPDSFSDGGRYHRVEAAVKRALSMLDSGADIIDVGGESTRPGSTPVSADEEIARVAPVIEQLRAMRTEAVISVDTMKSETAEAALKAGADIVNDISGLTADAKTAEVAAAAGAGLVLMHMRGTPVTMQSLTTYEDLVSDISDALLRSVEIAEAAGARRDNIVLDPGIGFAKTAEQNLEILRRIREFRELGYPILVGPSRKSFIGEALAEKGVPRPSCERESGTAAVVAWLAFKKVEIVRVHEPREARDVIKVIRSIENGN